MHPPRRTDGDACSVLPNGLTVVNPDSRWRKSANDVKLHLRAAPHRRNGDRMFTILVVLLALITVILAVAATRPASFQLERSATIAAPPEQIFPLLNDFHAWGAWSPWEHLDPNLKRTYDGATSGTGAVYSWVGNRKVGKGRMEITGESAPTSLTIQLDFIEPFEAHNVSTFALRPVEGGTHLTWAMDGPNTFMGKVMSVFVSMDKMVGKDLERGLETMKQVAER